MRAWLLGMLLATTLAGCTHISLRNNTVKTTGTIADLHFQQVLNNVALFVDDPAGLPSLGVVNAGTVSVQDQNAGDMTAVYSPTLSPAQQGGGALPILSLYFHPSFQRQITENWGVVPVTDAPSLRRLRCAYQLLVLGDEVHGCDDCIGLLLKYFGKHFDWECQIPRGWYQVGKKHDVPKGACYTACHCDTYVWVMPDGMDGFAHFTLTVLDLAANKPHSDKEDERDTMPPADSDADLEAVQRIIRDTTLTPEQRRKRLEEHFGPRGRLRPEGIPVPN